MSATRRARRALVIAVATGGAVVACSDRAAYWDTPVATTPTTYGLAGAVAVVDDPAHRVVMLTALGDQVLAKRSFPVGHHVASAVTSPDGKRLFILSTGDSPRRTAADEYPSLTMIDASTFDAQAARFTMSEPLANLAIDPMGRWVVAYAGAGSPSASFVQNPNEIVLFDLTAPPSATNPTARTIRSFGGSPQRLTFTPTLALRDGPRRLLLVETKQDVTLLDLDHAFDAPPRPEITVRLTSGADARQVTPAGLVVDDGDPTRADDARIALRTSDDSNVVTLQLAPATDKGPNDFTPTVNLTDVGGVASDIAFVRTDGGLRVAALVPSTSSAVLVEPDTSLTTQVALPSRYSRLSLVTDIVGAAKGTDVALLWSDAGSSAGVAFWTLGKTVGQPYRSIEVVGVNDAIHDVHDVPAPNDRLKVLEMTSSTGFFVLDLVTRTAAPLSTMTAATLKLAPDGGRMWAYARGGTRLAGIDFGSLHPVPLTTDSPIDAVYDVARPDAGRSLIAIHLEGSVGATVFDALAPDTATSRRSAAILLEGP